MCDGQTDRQTDRQTDGETARRQRPTMQSVARVISGFAVEYGFLCPYTFTLWMKHALFAIKCIQRIFVLMIMTRNKTRSFSTANGSRVIVRGRPCKIFLTSSLIIMQNLFVISFTVYAHSGGH